MTLLFFFRRSRRRWCPYRMNAGSEPRACLNAKPEKLRPLAQRVCAWASAIWCSPQRPSAIAFPVLQEVGATISNSTRLGVLKGHTGAVVVWAQGQATRVAITTITPVPEQRTCSRFGARVCREMGGRHHGGTHQQAPASVEVYRTAPKRWEGHPQEGAMSRAWAGVLVSPLKYLMGHTSRTHRSPIIPRVRGWQDRRIGRALCLWDTWPPILPCTDVWWHKCCSGQRGWERCSPSSQQFIGTHTDPSIYVT